MSTPTQTKSAFQKGQVALAMRTGEKTVDALLKDGLAIHKSVDEKRAYTITHIKSGQSVFGNGIRKQSSAKQAVIELTSLDIDWTDDAHTLKSFFSRNKEITNLIKMCQAKYRYL